jgi:hypothetical protein
MMTSSVPTALYCKKECLANLDVGIILTAGAGLAKSR